LYILKGRLNDEGEVEGESVDKPDEHCRVHVESSDMNHSWMVFPPFEISFTIRATQNFRVVETKTGNVLATLRSIPDAVQANGGNFVAY